MKSLKVKEAIKWKHPRLNRNNLGFSIDRITRTWIYKLRQNCEDTMTKPAFIASSDWHLERNAYVRHKDMRHDSYFALEQIVSLSIDRKLPLLAAGDLFETAQPDSYTVCEMVSQVDRLKQAGCRLYYVRGQHDGDDERPWLQVHPWPIYLNKTRAAVAGFMVYGIDYKHSDELLTALTEIPANTNVLLTHQVWKDFMGSRGGDASLASVPHVQAVVTGDFHQHVVMDAVGSSGQTMRVFSPGSTCLQSVSEPPDKYVFVVNDDLSYESVFLRSRPFYRFELHTEEELESFLANQFAAASEPATDLPNYVATPMIEIRFDQDLKDAHRRITAADNGKTHLFMTPIKQEIGPIPIAHEDNLKTIERGLAGNLHRLCPIDSQTYKLAWRMLNSRTPADELDKAAKEWLSCADA